MSDDKDLCEAALTTALTTVEATGRLAVHAWAALEQGNATEAMRLIGAMSDLMSTTMAEANLDEERAALVRTAARDLVNPVIGWPQGPRVAPEHIALPA